MPNSRRSRPPRTNGADPADETIEVGARRSRRLMQDEPDEVGLPAVKRRRRRTKSVNEEPEEEAEDALETSDGASSRRDNASDARNMKRRQGNDERANRRTAETLQPKRRSRSTRSRQRIAQSPDRSPTEPEKRVEDIYEVPDSPPRRTRRTAKAVQDGPYSDPEDELFVRQDEHSEEDLGENEHSEMEHDEEDEEENGTTGLYDEPTRGGGNEEEEESSEDEDQPPLPTLSQLRNDLPEMDESASILPDGDSAGPVDIAYPDDHLLFNAPVGDDRITAVSMRSKALKSMAELMSRAVWKRTSSELLSKWIRKYWEDVISLQFFWENMPPAPDYAGQCDYMHSGEDAAEAKASIERLDELVESIVEHARVTSPDDDDLEDITSDLRGKIIPKLVTILCSVFRLGICGNPQRWRAMVTNPTLQIMHRLLAWIKYLYGAMMKGSKTMNKGKAETKAHLQLGRYMQELHVEFDEALRELRDIPIRKREYEERRRQQLETEERNRLRAQELRNRQYEIAAQRIRERFGPPGAEPLHGSQSAQTSWSTASQQTQSSEQTQASFSTLVFSQQESQRTQASSLTSIPPRMSLAELDGDDSWPAEKRMELLKVLMKTPTTRNKHLSFYFECSEEEVRDVREGLKRAAREHAINRNETVPEFARI
ncbi:hypothetical protein CkaCkLH20_06243 [Colletotrichum karsti]|uniref:Uncharacterized protein n=1 Tax=Colletotrichum karsti TaxID=1095194 RepID=A0A9P6LKP9_9PEZI|nr:uncharacterized protein CkaCkLH20_06243 [Colletotrichum karsti]KAF9876300.1 hypothetical protein CkaCkLH20_06243 [Colletotrichum karsti]